MTAREILKEKLRDELLFPKLLPYRNSLETAKQSMRAISKRLYKKNPLYKFTPRYIPDFEKLPFFAEMGEDFIVQEVIKIYHHDRQAIVGAMEVLDLHVGVPLQGERVFWEFVQPQILDEALQEVSKKEGNGEYIVTLYEIPGLDLEKGMKLLTQQLVSRYRDRYNIPDPAVVPVEQEEDLAQQVEEPKDGEKRTLEQEKQELAQQVEALEAEAEDLTSV